MFKNIARIIEAQVGAGFTDDDYDRGWHDAVKVIAEKLAEYLKSENPLFGRQAFLKACGFDTEQKWNAVPYNDRTDSANPFAVATIIDDDGEIIADVFSEEAVALIEMAPEVKKRLSEYERTRHG